MNTERKTSRADIERYDLEILLRRPSLRLNIPRRNSQACPPIIQTEETACGLGCIRGEWLQSFANRNAFLFVYGVLGCFYGSYYTYFYGSVTTLEKLYKMSSQTIGTIATIGDLTQIITCFLLSTWTPKIYRSKLIGFGVYTIILSTIVASLPHFLYGIGKAEQRRGSTNFTYLRNQTFESRQIIYQSECAGCVNNEAEERIPIILLIVAQILHGIGGSFYLIVGASYKEDNVKKYQPPALLSLLFILKTLGPALGYWLSSMCLKIFASPVLTPQVNETHPQWIGAWWLGNLILGFMLFIPASIIILFPSILPKTALRRMLVGTQGKTETKHNFLIKGALTTFKGLVLNSTFNCNNFAGVFNILGFTAYFLFIPKYVTIQYRVSDSSANFIAGSVTLIVAALGILVATSVITRYKPTARSLSGWNVFVGLLSMCCLISYIHFDCPSNDAQITKLVPQLLNNSSIRCKCDTFAPVCSKSGETFISPCHADCSDILYINTTKVYVNCNNALLNSSETKTVFDGVCPVDCHFDFIIFFIVTCAISFINATGRISNILFQMKFIENEEKSYLLRILISCLGLFSLFPTPILFGYILDESCLFWEKTCTRTGNCWLYDNQKLRHSMNLTALGFVFVGIMFDLGIWYHFRNLKLFDDSDEQVDENEEN